MAIRFITAWERYPVDTIATFSAPEEARLIALGFATTDLDLEQQYVQSVNAITDADGNVISLVTKDGKPVSTGGGVGATTGGGGASGMLSGAYFSADYIVSEDDGNDTTGNGTRSAPWATLEKAILAANAATGNKTIYITAGLNYTRNTTTNIREGVSIIGAGRDLVSIKITQTGGNQNNAGLLLSSTAEGTAGNQTLSGFTLDGGDVSNVPYCAYGINIRGRSNVIVHDFRLKNFGTWGITFNGQATEVDGIGASILATGNKCFNFIIDNCSTYAETGGSSIGYGGLQFGSQYEFEAYNGTINQTTRPSGQNGYCIKMHRNGYNVKPHLHHLTLNRNNTGCTFPFDSEMWNTFGLHSHHNQHSGAFDLICNKGTNAITNAGTPNVEYGAWLHHNVFNITTQGLNGAGNTMCFNLEDQRIGACSDIIIENNIDIGNGSTTGAVTLVKVFSTATALRPLTWNNIIIRNNVKVGGQILGEMGVNQYDTFSNWSIYNNTGDGKDRTDKALDGISLTKATWVNAKIRQNILCNYRRAPVVSGDGANASVTGLVEDLNLYFACGNPTAQLNNIRTHIAASGATAPTGVTGTNLNNPASMASMFIDSAANNYHLKQGAQVHNIGAQLSVKDYDDVSRYSYDGNSVVIPYTDAGAFVYVGTAYNMPVYTVNRSDNFNRADGAIGTPSDAGAAWQSLSGTWTIASNKATTSSNNARVVLTGSSANVRVTATFNGTGGGAILLRAVDNNNHFQCYLSTTQVAIVKVVAGAGTPLVLLGNTFTSGDIMDASIDSAGLITIIKNGIVICSTTDNSFPTETKHGLWGTNSGGTFIYDDFSISNIT